MNRREIHDRVAMALKITGPMTARNAALVKRSCVSFWSVAQGISVNVSTHHESLALPVEDWPKVMEDCPRCQGEGRVPVFEDRDGLSMPVGYRPCDCLELE